MIQKATETRLRGLQFHFYGQTLKKRGRGATIKDVAARRDLIRKVSNFKRVLDRVKLTRRDATLTRRDATPLFSVFYINEPPDRFWREQPNLYYPNTAKTRSKAFRGLWSSTFEDWSLDFEDFGFGSSRFYHSYHSIFCVFNVY